MIRLPELSEKEIRTVHQNYVRLTDIFLQGLILYLFKEREDGFHKAFHALRRAHENHKVDDQILEKKLTRFLQHSSAGRVSVWMNLLAAAEKGSEPIRKITVQICPDRIKKQYSSAA